MKDLLRQRREQIDLNAKQRQRRYVLSTLRSQGLLRQAPIHQCSECMKWKFSEAFTLRSDTIIGLSAKCKACETQSMHPDEYVYRGRPGLAENMFFVWYRYAKEMAQIHPDWPE